MKVGDLVKWKWKDHPSQRIGVIVRIKSWKKREQAIVLWSNGRERADETKDLEVICK